MIKISSGGGDGSFNSVTNRGNLWHLSPMTWNYYKNMSLDQTYSKW